MKVVKEIRRDLSDFRKDVHRVIFTIDCQQGQLGLAVDLTPRRLGFSVKVSYYVPATSGGYHRLYQDGDVLTINQIASMKHDILVDLIDRFGAYQVLPDGFISASKFREIEEFFGFHEVE